MFVRKGIGSSYLSGSCRSVEGRESIDEQKQRNLCYSLVHILFVILEIDGWVGPASDLVVRTAKTDMEEG